MKWVALSFIVMGLGLIAAAMLGDSKSNFDDGSFLVQIGAVFLGGASILAGLIIFGAELFIKL